MSMISRWLLITFLMGCSGGLAAHAASSAMAVVRATAAVINGPTICDTSPLQYECRPGVPAGPWTYTNYLYTLADHSNYIWGSYPTCGGPLSGGPPFYLICPSFADALAAQITQSSGSHHQNMCPDGQLTSPVVFGSLMNLSLFGLPNEQSGNFGFEWYHRPVVNGQPVCTLIDYGSLAVRKRHITCPVGWLPGEAGDANNLGYCYRRRVSECRSTGSSPFSTDGANGCSCGIANPVNPQNGDKLATESDFQGVGAFPLSFVRSYRSSGFPYPIYSQREGGAMGRVWRHNYERELIPGTGTNADSVYVVRSNGLYAHFSRSGTAWVGDSDDGSTLVEETNGDWIYKDLDDSVEVFAADGKLQSITNREGHSQLLSYNGSGQLTTVIDPSGRMLQFTYNADGLVAFILMPDGQTISYGYGDGGQSDGQLTETIPPAPPVAVRYNLADRLETVTFPGAIARSYLYNEAGLTSHNPNGGAPSGIIEQFWAMTGIVDENGDRYGTYTWFSNGKVKVSEHSGGADRHEFSYVTVNNGAGSTTVIDPLGTSRTYSHVLSGNAVRSAGVSQPCPTCGGSNAQTKTYDSNGYKDLVTDFNGTVTNYDHNTRGLETIRIEAQGKDTQVANPFSDERKTETDWHTSFRVPTERRSYRCSALDAEQAQPCSGVGGSNLWQLESLSRYSHNARGQTAARCVIDPTDPTALAYTCGSSVDAPPRVRQTLTTYCEAGDVAAPGSTCPLLGLVKTMNGPRTGVNDLGNYTYYAADHVNCAALPTTCAYRKGDLWKVTNALNQVSEYLSYDGAGRVKRMKDTNGVITDLTYHARGWLATRTVRANTNGTANASLDAVTTLTYDNVGQVTRVTQADGAYIDYTYDAAHRLTGISDNLGNTLSYTLDAAGNRTAENTRDPSNTLTRTLGRVYDSLGRLHKLLNAQSAETVFAYDANGNQDTVTDALLRVTDSDVDPLNRLIKSTDALMGNTQYRYDARDNLTKVIDAKGLATDYVYDGLSDLMQLVSPDTGTTNYTYDSAGNRATQTDARGVVSSYSYDVLNRLIGIGYPTSSNNVAFSYDQNHGECDADEQFGIGRLTGFTDPSGSTKLCYDLRGNVRRKLVDNDGTELVTSWRYNTADRVIQVGYPSGTVVDYGRDALGRLHDVVVTDPSRNTQELITSVTYYPFGPVREIAWANGTTTQRTYDQNYWIAQIDTTQSTGLQLDFDLDAVGNITGLSDVIAAAQPGNVYGYDALYRLEDVNTPTADVESFTYDAIGNRLSKTLGNSLPQNYEYEPGSHRLLVVEDAEREYDENGNTLIQNAGSRSAPILDYDERNRLSHAGRSALNLNFVHNARGERVQKVNVGSFGPISQLFSYDEAGRLLSEQHKSARSLHDYIWLDDLPVAVLEEGALHLVHADHLGSPRKVIDTRTDTAIWNWPILDNPFGEAAPDQDSDGNSVPFEMNLRFPGQYFDVETGLHYNYFRDYEPGTGRYVESDPIGLRGGVSTFGYVSGNPLALKDPRGEVGALVFEGALLGGGICYLAYQAYSHRPVLASGSDVRPPGYPPELPHPSDPLPTYTCTVIQPCSPPPEAPGPNSGCQLKYSMMIARCKQLTTGAGRVTCQISAMLFLLICEASMNL